MKRTLIISDFHLKNGRLSNIQKELVLLFTKQILNKHYFEENKIKTFALLGDIFEFWEYKLSCENLPKKSSHILLKEDFKPITEFVRAIKELQKQIPELEVVYVSGNHDNFLDKEIIKESFGKDTIFCDAFCDNGIHFEHGHRFDLLNTPNEPKTNNEEFEYCMGYYYSRFREDYPIKLNAIQNIFLKLIVVFSFIFFKFPKILRYFFRKLLNMSFPKKYNEKTIFLRRGKSSEVVVSVKFKELKEKLQDYLNEFSKSKFISRKLFLALLKGSMNDYSGVIYNQDYLNLFGIPKNTKAIVTGHTHVPLLEKKKIKSSDKFIVLGNTGGLVRARATDYEKKEKQHSQSFLTMMTIEKDENLKIILQKVLKKENEEKLSIEILKKEIIDPIDEEKKVYYEFDSKSIKPLMYIKEINA